MDARPSNWTLADPFTLEDLRLILLLVREYYELFGNFPSATELRAKMRQPS